MENVTLNLGKLKKVELFGAEVVKSGIYEMCFCTRSAREKVENCTFPARKHIRQLEHGIITFSRVKRAGE